VKKRKLKKIFRSLSFNLISSTVLTILFLGLLLASIGYYRFSDAVTDQYEDAAYRTAETALLLVDNNKIDDYLQMGESDPQYQQVFGYLLQLREAQNVTIIYVIKPNEDFSGYYSVFNIPDTSIYTPWEVNSFHEISDAEYGSIYKRLYEDESFTHTSVLRANSTNVNIPDHITTLLIIRDDEGNPTGIMCVQKLVENLKVIRSNYMRVIGIVTIIMIVFSIIAWVLFLRYQFANPIQKIVMETERFKKAKTPPDNSWTKKFSRIYEIDSLAHSIKQMEIDTIDYIENITTAQAEKEKIGVELQIASQIQSQSIPAKFPAFPDRNEFDLYANMTPAKEVGGDFYDFFFIDDDHLGLVIADVSGKGVPAALFMMVSLILLKEHASLGGSPGEVLTFLNDKIMQYNESEMFVTIWFGILDIPTGKIVYANAGHDDPILYRKGQSFEIYPSKHGLVVGAMEDIRYKEYELTLNKGDKLFIYTDGVPEATRSDNQMFRIANVIESLNARKDESPKEIIEGMKSDINGFVGDAPQFDDMTMLCFEYFGPTTKNTITLDATDDNLDSVNAFVAKVLQEANCPQKAIGQIMIAVEEVYVNIVHHAYENTTGEVQVDIIIDNKKAIMSFIDSGRAYNPLERKDPDITLKAEDRSIGGLGVYMTKKLMTSMRYERKDDKNILIMEKNFGKD